ncbi:MAG: NAD(P)/FAD-dependent oxidoreductase, partial [Candidatus Hodgkinia cicadicola]
MTTSTITPKPELINDTISQVKVRTVEKVAIIGSGIAGYSASHPVCANHISPLMLTGVVVGGHLTKPKSLKFWPGAQPNMLSTELATSLNEQALRLGVRFLYDSVQSIDFNVQPYTIVTSQGKVIFAETIIIATGLEPKTLNLPNESELLDRNVFTSAASIKTPHKDAAVIGNDESAVEEALTLSTTIPQVTLLCSSPQLTCPPSQLLTLTKTANIRMEYNVKVTSYLTDKTDNGLVLRGVTYEQSSKTISLDVTAIVLAQGSKPKVDLFPDSAKTTSGFIKTSFDDPSLKGIFPAGSIVE